LAEKLACKVVGWVIGSASRKRFRLPGMEAAPPRAATGKGQARLIG
jgi:hypothetical protein